MFPDISPLHTLSVITLMTSSLLSLETITSQICNLFCTTQVSPLYLCLEWIYFTKLIKSCVY